MNRNLLNESYERLEELRSQGDHLKARADNLQAALDVVREEILAVQAKAEEVNETIRTLKGEAEDGTATSVVGAWFVRTDAQGKMYESPRNLTGVGAARKARALSRRGDLYVIWTVDEGGIERRLSAGTCHRAGVISWSDY